MVCKPTVFTVSVGLFLNRSKAKRLVFLVVGWSLKYNSTHSESESIVPVWVFWYTFEVVDAPYTASIRKIRPEVHIGSFLLHSSSHWNVFNCQILFYSSIKPFCSVVSIISRDCLFFHTVIDFKSPRRDVLGFFYLCNKRPFKALKKP